MTTINSYTLDAQALAAENTRLRAALAAVELLAWRRAAMFLLHHRDPQPRAAALLDRYASDVLEIQPTRPLDPQDPSPAERDAYQPRHGQPQL
jgi:hypothetical protein